MGRECEKTIVFAAHSLPSAASTTVTSRAPTELRTLTPNAFVRTVLPSALRVGGATVLAAAGLSSRRQDRLGGRRDRLGGRRDRLRGRQDEVGNMHAARRKVWNNQRKVNKLCSQVEK